MKLGIMANDAVKRWVGISLRTMHLIGVAGVGGGFLYKAPYMVWKPYLVLLIVSGVGMLFLDIWFNVQCLLQVRGIATIVKLFLMGASFFVGMEAYMLITVIVISGVISHAPGKVRYFSLMKALEKGKPLD
jgi:hypothetical protein